MEEIKVKDFVRVTNAKLICGDENIVLRNFKKDTREINKRRYLCWYQRRKL